MNDDQISVQLYSVRNAIAENLNQALERIAGTGLRNVELYGFVDTANEYAQALKSAGLSAPSAHAPLLQMPDPERAFEAANICGVRTLIDPYYDPRKWAAQGDVSEIADRLNALAETAAPYQVEVGYHNHEFEVEARFADVSAFEWLATKLDPAVVLEVDTYWVQVAGESAPALLGRLGKRVTHIHVKDGPLSMNDAEQLPAGSGAMDIPAVLAAAPNALRVIEFDDYRGDPFDGITDSLKFLRAQESTS